MVSKVYSVFDSKIGAYMAPFVLPSKGAAIRAFTDIAKDSSSNIGKHPEDYVLFELGDFDDSSAKFTLYEAPLSIGIAIEFLGK